MKSNSNVFCSNLEFVKETTFNEFSIIMDKKNKFYYLFKDNKPILICKNEQNNYNIYDLDNRKVAELTKERYFFNKKYYLYFKEKKNNQILGIFKKKKKNENLLIIPITDEFNGINTFKNYKDLKSTSKKKLLIEEYPFIKSVRYKNTIESKKNSKYFYLNKLVFEISKYLDNSYNLYFDKPLSIVQGFSLGLICILTG